jgi:uncharacterized pyridoxal phosphate-dependent enzyme
MSISDWKNKVTRRSFLRSQVALAAVAAAPLGPAASARAAHTDTPAGDDYYAKLGVNTFINAAGTKTVLTAACMPPSVQAAVAQAAKHWVHLRDLQEKAGAYIANRTNNEGCCITCGATSAIALATAACVQAANNCKPTDIPRLIGTPQYPNNEVIVQEHYGYEEAILLSGVKLVLVRSLDEYKKAFGPKTVMTNFVDASLPAKSSDELTGHATAAGFSAGISREDWLAVAHEHGVPCHLDAAADCLPIERLWKYTQMGFDLVAFSGGKCLEGPQNAGLLLGKKKYIDLAHRNNNPSDGVGRGMKVAKEQLVGMVAAVDWILSQTDEGIDKRCRDQIAVIDGLVKDIPTVKTSILVPPISNHVPHLIIDFDPKVIGASALELKARLATGTPAIEINPQTGSPHPNQDLPPQPNALVIYVYLLRPGEDAIVARQIRQALKNPKSIGTWDPSAIPPSGQGGEQG